MELRLKNNTLMRIQDLIHSLKNAGGKKKVEGNILLKDIDQLKIVKLWKNKLH